MPSCPPMVIGVKSMQVYDFKPLELVSLGISLHELIEILTFWTIFYTLHYSLVN